MKKTSRKIPKYAEMRHGDVILTLQCPMMSRIDMRSACGRHAAVHFLSSHRLVQVYEIELSNMSKINGHPDLVCQKNLSSTFPTESDYYVTKKPNSSPTGLAMLKGLCKTQNVPLGGLIRNYAVHYS